MATYVKDLNYFQNGTNLLHEATAEGSVLLVRSLLRAGARVNAANNVSSSCHSSHFKHDDLQFYHDDELVNFQEMCRNCGTEVRCTAGKTETFKVKVGLHQGSALSSLLLVVVMGVLPDEVRGEKP